MTTDVTETINAVSTKPSGMQFCKGLFEEVNAEGYDLGEFKSARQAFINRAMSEANLKQTAAATYWHNLKTHAAGGKLYPYADRVRRKKQAANAVETFKEVAAEIKADQTEFEGIGAA